MESEGVIEALTTIAACGGIGAFMDFWIGKNGQERVRDWLETWWLRFSYVNARNFGREEALFAVGIMDRIFGNRFWSLRRILLMFSIGVIGALLAVDLDAAPWAGLDLMAEAKRRYFQVSQPIIVGALLFGLSISLTRFIAIQSANVLRSRQYLGAGLIATMLLIQCVLLGYWSPIVTNFIYLVRSVCDQIAAGQTPVVDPLLQVFAHMRFSPFRVTETFLVMRNGEVTPEYMPVWLRYFTFWLGVIPNLGRILLTAIFLGSYAVKPLHNATSTLWARIVESNKPIFTLVFGGTAALAQSAAWVLRHL